MIRWLLWAVLAVAGCSQAAQLASETEQGGVVTYVYKPERGGAMVSRYRADALDLIRKKCPSGYVITREGEAKTNDSVGGVIEGTEDEVRHRWGLEFKCKGS